MEIKMFPASKYFINSSIKLQNQKRKKENSKKLSKIHILKKILKK